jgi:polyisoprenoid-binding protein YceI
MRKILIFTTALAVSGAMLTAFIVPAQTPRSSSDQTAIEAGKWTVDRSHSNVKFTVTHLVVSEVEGAFKMFEGSMENSNGDLTDAKINFTVDVNSISTDNERRDNHLKSDDFFNAEKFPAMKFTSTSMKPVGDNKYKLRCNLWRQCKRNGNYKAWL